MNEGKVSKEKACQIMRDGTAQGRPLTDKQKRYFGAICGGATPWKESVDQLISGNLSLDDVLEANVKPGELQHFNLKPAEPRQVKYRPYKCSDCGKEQSLQTNHTGEVSAYCHGCSWKPSFGNTGHKIPALGGHTYRRFTYSGE